MARKSSIDFTASAGLPTDPSQGSGFGFDGDFFNYAVGVTLGAPLDRRQWPNASTYAVCGNA